METLVEDITQSSMTTSEERITIDYEWVQKIEKIMVIVKPIIFLFIIVIGGIGNSLVLYVVAKNKYMRSPKNLLIANLALADITFIVICAPFAIPLHWPFGNIFCKIWKTTNYCTAIVSVYTLALISIERFLAIIYPVKSISWRTNLNIWIAITTTWIIVLIFCAPIPFSYSAIRRADNHSYCRFSYDEKNSILPKYWEQYFRVLFFLAGFMLPMLVMVGLYSIMSYKLWKQDHVSGKSFVNIKKNRQIVKLFIVVVTAFGVCWIPIHICNLLQVWGISTSTTPFLVAFKLTSHAMAVSNSWINPIIYGFLYEPFRRGLRINGKRTPRLSSFYT